jgi:hypothetical protein
MSWSRTTRFTVHHVTSTDNPPLHCTWSGDHWEPVQSPVPQATAALTTVYPETFNGLLALVAEFNEAYQVDRPVVAGVGIGPRDAKGRQLAYRWSWERLTSWNGRISDTLFVTVDAWE